MVQDKLSLRFSLSLTDSLCIRGYSRKAIVNCLDRRESVRSRRGAAVAILSRRTLDFTRDKERRRGETSDDPWMDEHSFSFSSVSDRE